MVLAAAAWPAGAQQAGPAAADGADRGPLVQLQQLVGENDHLHTDEIRYRESDAKLFHCSYNFGVIDARDPARMVYLAQELRHRIPNDTRRPGCIHLAWDGNIVYTTHRGNIDNPTFLTGWDLRPDPANPQKIDPIQLPVLQEPGVSYEGVDAANGLVYVALRRDGLGVYERGDGGGLVRIGHYADLNNTWGVRVRGTTAFVSDGLAGLAILDVSNARRPTLVSRLDIGGQARGLAIDGDTVYIAAGSAGLVIVDVARPREPRVISRTPGTGSAIRVDYSQGRAYLAAWNDARVYDVSTPATPRFIGSARMTRNIGNASDERPEVTSRTLGVAARGDVMFAGNWHVVHSFRVHPERRAPSLVLPEDINLVDFGPVAAGARKSVPLTIRNQGTAPLTISSASTTAAAFTVEPRQAEVQPGGSATLTVSYTASGAETTTAFLDLATNDPANRRRRGYLVANRPGLGVGKPLPETRVALVDGGQWSSTEAKGQVMLLAYFATF